MEHRLQPVPVLDGERLVDPQLMRQIDAHISGEAGMALIKPKKTMDMTKSIATAWIERRMI
jgi:hypothetical protein